jgi:hypothetical protein
VVVMMMVMMIGKPGFAACRGIGALRLIGL